MTRRDRPSLSVQSRLPCADNGYQRLAEAAGCRIETDMHFLRDIEMGVVLGSVL
jgi:hypothetical protein